MNYKELEKKHKIDCGCYHHSDDKCKLRELLNKMIYKKHWVIIFDTENYNYLSYSIVFSSQSDKTLQDMFLSSPDFGHIPKNAKVFYKKKLNFADYHTTDNELSDWWKDEAKKQLQSAYASMLVKLPLLFVKPPFKYLSN